MLGWGSYSIVDTKNEVDTTNICGKDWLVKRVVTQMVEEMNLEKNLRLAQKRIAIYRWEDSIPYHVEFVLRKSIEVDVNSLEEQS